MTTHYLEFMQRDFSSVAPFVPQLAYSVEQFTHNAMGGPKSMVVKATGAVEIMAQLKSLLRYGVRVFDEMGNLRWWGFVRSVAISNGAYSYGWSLDSMANRVAVGYSMRGGGRGTTPFAANGVSVQTYGKKELLYTMNDADSAIALATSTTLVARLADPVKTMEYTDASDMATATIECGGWWETLGWIYCPDETGGIERGDSSKTTTGDAITLSFINEPENGTIDIGTTTSQYAALPVTFSGSGRSYDLSTFKSKVVRIGAAVDNLEISLLASSGGAPGSVLATISLAGSDMQTSHYWQDFSYQDKPAIVPGALYFIRYRRSGALDNTNFYRVATNTTPVYSGGAALVYTGAAYVATSPAEYPLFSASADDVGLHLDLGTVSGRSQLARSFSVSYSYPIAFLDVELDLEKVNSPVDNVVVEIAAGTGSAALATATIAAAGLSADRGRVRVSFALPVAISTPATLYLRVKRSGALDPYNFVRVWLDPSAPTDGGSFLIYNGVSWPVALGDLIFSLTVGAETTQQIKALVTTAGQFFVGIDIDANSGVYAAIATNSDATVQKRVEDLLGMGNSSGLSLYGRIMPTLRALIYAEPTAVTFYMAKDGRVIGAMNTALAADECPTGVLVSPVDLDLQDVKVFIQEARYSSGKDRTTYTSRDVSGQFEIGGTVQG